MTRPVPPSPCKTIGVAKLRGVMGLRRDPGESPCRWSCPTKAWAVGDDRSVRLGAHGDVHDDCDGEGGDVHVDYSIAVKTPVIDAEDERDGDKASSEDDD